VNNNFEAKTISGQKQFKTKTILRQKHNFKAKTISRHKHFKTISRQPEKTIYFK